jgi:hypothetical protein
MGVFERIFIAVAAGQVEDEVVDQLYGYRLANIWHNKKLVRVKPRSTGQYRVTSGASKGKVLLDQERWELSKLPAPGLKEHLSDAIVACPGEDARIVR